MSILKKLSTAIRGHATELGEEVVDANALTILDQEIRDARKELDASKTALADIMGKRKVQEDKLSKLRGDARKYEKSALDLEESDPLFLEVCERIEAIENEISPIQSIVEQYKASEEQLKRAIRQAEGNIKSLQSQVDTVKATEQVQKAQMAVSSKFTGNNASLSAARNSLDRIRERQAARAANIEAAQEVSSVTDDDLDARLARATGGGANSVAERLRAKKARAQ